MLQLLNTLVNFIITEWWILPLFLTHFIPLSLWATVYYNILYFTFCLYQMINYFFFVEFGRPAPNRINHLDAPNDFFRIRLCCTLLDTCGMCFDRGSSMKRLDDFLVFFQVNLFC